MPGPRRSTLVVGLGNPILGDDGVGWTIVDALAARLGADGPGGPAVEIDRLSVGGLGLMERLVGHERAIVVDAVVGADPAGTVRAGPLAAIATRGEGHLDSAHDVGLADALRAGRALGASLPDDITIVTVSVRRVDAFDERLSPAVDRAVDGAVATIVGLLAPDLLDPANRAGSADA